MSRFTYYPLPLDGINIGLVTFGGVYITLVLILILLHWDLYIWGFLTALFGLGMFF